MGKPAVPGSPQPNPTRTAWIAAMPAVFVVLWSTGFIGARLGLPYAEPFTFLLVRFVAVIALLTVVAIAFRAPWPTDLATFTRERMDWDGELGTQSSNSR